ncbi:phage late control D family protein [Xenorhabdus sp. 42]|nr:MULTISPECIES: phage late control D family protein [unclassified Xenorhabdus]MBD2793467.1 phage late control D family protein [Xenorhabdus sp. CUL]MBD2822795.1 phage late control D family protein [Xenorhabdus sp. 42]MBD2826761.1 phage late control D family protein [Xenorhabdus sp. 5]
MPRIDWITGSTNTPVYVLSAGDTHINVRIQNRLMSLNLTDNRGFEADQLDIELDDSDGLLSLPPRGTTLSLHLGWQGEALVHKGTFVVDEIEYSSAPDKINIRARSADFRATLNTSRELSYHQKTLSDIVHTVAVRNNLKPEIDKTLAGIRLNHIDQTNESDGSFLTRLAKQEGATTTVKNGYLLFMRQGQNKTVSGTPLPVVSITHQSGDGYRFSLADRSAYTGVSASWLNTREPKKKETVTVKRKRRKNNPKQKEEKQGEYLVGSEGNVLVLKHTYAYKSNAERAAKAEWEKIQRGVASFSLQLAKGRPELLPEMKVRVSGFKPEIDQADWTLVTVTHTLNDSGLTSTLELEVKISDTDMGA